MSTSSYTGPDRPLTADKRLPHHLLDAETQASEAAATPSNGPSPQAPALRLRLRHHHPGLMLRIAGATLGVWLAVLLATTPASAIEGQYHGRVVDAETKHPLEGAVVTVIWMRYPFFSMNGVKDFHQAREMLTDAEGGSPSTPSRTGPSARWSASQRSSFSSRATGATRTCTTQS